MFIIRKLQNLIDSTDAASIDGILSAYFLNHLPSSNRLTLSQIMADTSISRASIYRFINRGGYKSFNDFKEEFYDEWTVLNDLKPCGITFSSVNTYLSSFGIDKTEIDMLANALRNADNVALAGDPDETECLRATVYALHSAGKKLLNLTSWYIDDSRTKLMQLGKDDVLIFVNTCNTIDKTHERFMRYQAKIGIEEILSAKCHKFFIGKGGQKDYRCIQVISFPDISDDCHMSWIGLAVIDYKLSERLMVTNK